jgi:hypothetical protein
VTEAQWLASEEPEAMLDALRGRAGARKLRLFAAACCRVIWSNFKLECHPAAVEILERYADGLAAEEELLAATRAVDETRVWGGYAVGAIYSALTGEIRTTVSAATKEFAPSFHLCSVRKALFAGFLRDILGNPFRPAALDPSWLAWNGGTLPKLAAAAYEDRRLPEGTLDPVRLALVADALEDAGCADRELLGHLRGPGPHVRGCWAVDLLLEKG